MKMEYIVISVGNDASISNSMDEDELRDDLIEYLLEKADYIERNSDLWLFLKHKKELNNKLAFNLHQQIIFNFISDNIFQEFFIYCSQIYHTLQMISSVKFQVQQFIFVMTD